MNRLALIALGAAGILTAQAAMAELSTADKEFAKQAARAGHAEVELGKIGQQKAADAQVKQYAEMMVKDHTSANRKLEEIASEKSLELPTEPDAEHQQALEKLRDMTGAEFDRAFMAQMVDDHNKATDLFGRQAKSGSDEDLKRFAEDTLGTLEHHLDMAKERHAALESRDGTARARMKSNEDKSDKIEEVEE